MPSALRDAWARTMVGLGLGRGLGQEVVDHGLVDDVGGLHPLKLLLDRARHTYSISASDDDSHEFQSDRIGSNPDRNVPVALISSKSLTGGEAARRLSALPNLPHRSVGRLDIAPQAIGVRTAGQCARFASSFRRIARRRLAIASPIAGQAPRIRRQAIGHQLGQADRMQQARRHAADEAVPHAASAPAVRPKAHRSPPYGR